MCAASSFAGIIAGAVILALICTFLPILIPVCVVCYIRIRICGSSRNRRPTSQVVTTAALPPTTSSQKVDYPPAYPPAPLIATQPPTYAAQPPAPYPTQPPAPYSTQPPVPYSAQDTSAAYPTQPLNESYSPQAAGYSEEPPPYGGNAYALRHLTHSKLNNKKWITFKQ